MEFDILIYRVGCESRPVFAKGPTWIARVKAGSARWATVMNTNVTCDPPLYTVPHVSEVDDNFASLAITIDPIAFAGWARSGARTFDCRVGHQCPSMRQMALAFALGLVTRLNVDPLALVVPIGGFVDDFQFRQRKYVGSEA